MTALKVVVVGESWHGSDSKGLARGFRACGHAVELIRQDTFFPAVDRSLRARGLRRALGGFYRNQFNVRILGTVRSRRPDIVVVYKGTAIRTGNIGRGSP